MPKTRITQDTWVCDRCGASEITEADASSTGLAAKEVLPSEWWRGTIPSRSVVLCEACCSALEAWMGTEPPDDQPT